MSNTETDRAKQTQDAIARLSQWGSAAAGAILVCEELERLQRDRDELLACLEGCLPFVDICRRLTGGEGDIAAMNARCAIKAAKGG